MAEQMARLLAQKKMDRLLTQKQMVELTGMSSQWFEISRHRGTGIPFCRLGRAIRYRTSDVQKWIEDHMVGTNI